jgi:hypothetical protein
MITKKCQKMPKMPKKNLICYANKKMRKKRLLDHKRKNDKK